MTETAVTPLTSPDRYTDWAFVDKAKREGSPVHIAMIVHINGEKADITVARTEPIIVRNRGGEDALSETLVSIVVLADDVTFMDTPTGVAVDTIGGVPVLTPPAHDEFQWHKVVRRDPAPVMRPNGSDFPYQHATIPAPEWVRVWVQARSVSFGYVGD